MKYFIALYEDKIGIRSIVLGISVFLCKFCAINYVKSNIVEIYLSMKVAWWMHQFLHEVSHKEMLPQYKKCYLKRMLLLLEKVETSNIDSENEPFSRLLF